MTIKQSFFSRIATTCIVLLALLMAAQPGGQVSAALVRCRTDPIFTLSNGDVVTVTLCISTDATNVKKVVYTLHVPAGVTIKKVTYVGDFPAKETYKLLQDSAAKTYVTDTLVSLSVSGSVAVVATSDLNSKTSVVVNGLTGSNVTATLKKP